MENITIGEIIGAVVLIGGFIGSYSKIKGVITDTINKTLQPLNNKIDKLEKTTSNRMNDLELSSTKTDLVNFMSQVENGHVSPEQIENAYQLFDRYEKLGGNGFIHSKWEKLKKEGKI